MHSDATKMHSGGPESGFGFPGPQQKKLMRTVAHHDGGYAQTLYGSRMAEITAGAESGFLFQSHLLQYLFDVHGLFLPISSVHF